MASLGDSKDSHKRDLIHLTGPLTREAILRQLHENFMEGYCYTWIGPVLLCVNPFENPSAQMMKTLQEMGRNLIDELHHSRRTRMLLFSGMSGSGKTFTSERLIIKMFSDSAKSEWLQDIRKYWQVSSVVLKALGTAGTASNKDSSRIGRLIEFHYHGLQITRLKINCYFLDQTRIVSPSQTEQNYHIFYQILAGLSTEERSKFYFPHYDSRTLHYLSQAADPLDSPQQLQSHFEAWKSSLAQLGIPLNDVLKVLVAVLLLGNILFYEAKNQELSYQGADELKAVASLLGIHPHVLQQGLTMRTYLSQYGSVKSTCSAAGANSARDALAKALYIRTVVAVMRRINTLLKGAGLHSPMKPHNKVPQLNRFDSLSPQVENVVSIVDFFGFEVNESNSLEQLCINWTAEKIQNFYVQSVFNDTLKASQMEGIDPLFESELHDCGPCIDLIGNSYTGILKEVNQETLSPRVSSQDIRVRMKNKYSSNEYFIPPAGSSSTFVIKHYYGDVSYDTYSILNANADTLADDIIAIFSNRECKFGFVTHLFSVESMKELQRDGNPKGQMCRITPALLQHVSHSDGRQPSTFVQDFQAHIEDVISALKKSKPYFIRCIKSNNTQTPGKFDREVVSEQINRMSIFETVDLIQGGYFHHMYYKDFVRRYQMIAPRALERLRSRAHEMTEDLLSAFMEMLNDKVITDDMWAYGNTQVFLNEEFKQHLEQLRDNVRHQAAVKIQSYVRRFLAMRQWPQAKYSMEQAHLQTQALSQITQSSSSPPPPPVPVRKRNPEKDPSLLGGIRNYTIVGNYKVAFPQWRVMKCSFPESGTPILQPGEEVYVVGRSQRRGYLIIEYEGKQLLVPHHYTELMLSPPTSSNGQLQPVHQMVSSLNPQSTFSEL